MQLKQNKLKTAFSENRQTYGSWVTVPDILIPEIMSRAGFDWLCIDMEHSSIELMDLLPLLISIENNGMVPLVRIGENNPTLIKRVMDAGVYGIIVPNVNSADEAAAAVNAVRYPPNGKRGVGLYRAQGYGFSFKDYLHWLENESIVIVQIEHIDAVKNIDEIFSVSGIDAFIIGPYDLSGSLGKPGDFNDMEVKDAIETTLRSGEKHGIIAGFHSVSSDPSEALKYKKKGFKLLGFSLDSIFLGDSVISSLNKLKDDKNEIS